MLKGKELQIIRIQKELLGQDLAKMLEISQSYVSKMEREVVHIPPKLYKKWVRILEGEKI